MFEALQSITGRNLVENASDVIGTSFRHLASRHNSSTGDKFRLDRNGIIRHMMACALFLNGAVEASKDPGVVYVRRTGAFVRYYDHFELIHGIFSVDRLRV